MTKAQIKRYCRNLFMEHGAPKPRDVVLASGVPGGNAAFDAARRFAKSEHAQQKARAKAAFEEWWAKREVNDNG